TIWDRGLIVLESLCARKEFGHLQLGCFPCLDEGQPAMLLNLESGLLQILGKLRPDQHFAADNLWIEGVAHESELARMMSWTGQHRNCTSGTLCVVLSRA